MLFCSLKYIVIIACIFKKKTFQELKELEIRKFQEVCLLFLLPKQFLVFDNQST